MAVYGEISGVDLAALRGCDTPTVCNVIELAGLRPKSAGFADRRLMAAFPSLPPMVGYASTATFRSAEPPAGDNSYQGLEEQLEKLAELTGPPVVVFQDLDDPAAAATFGEILCTTYQRCGAVGLVTSGAGRDLEHVARLKFPCFTTGAMGAHGYCHFPSLHQTVRVCGLTIRPGDLLHGDSNGLTTIPAQVAPLVAEGCARYLTAEAEILNYLKESQVDRPGFAKARAECVRQLAAIEKWLKSKILGG